MKRIHIPNNWGSFIFTIVFLSVFGCCPSNKQLERSHIYTFVEQMPQYNGGTQQLLHDFNQSFTVKHKDVSDSSTLVFQFVVTKSGNLAMVSILGKEESGYTEYEKDAISVFKGLNNWKPGIHQGKKVNVMMKLPIHVDVR